MIGGHLCGGNCRLAHVVDLSIGAGIIGAELKAGFTASVRVGILTGIFVDIRGSILVGVVLFLLVGRGGKRAGKGQHDTQRLRIGVVPSLYVADIIGIASFDSCWRVGVVGRKKRRRDKRQRERG